MPQQGEEEEEEEEDKRLIRFVLAARTPRFKHCMPTTKKRAATHAEKAPKGQCGKCCDDVVSGSISPAAIGRMTGYRGEG